MPDGSTQLTGAPIAFTCFPNEKAFDKSEHSASLEEIARTICVTEAEEKSALPFIKLATFSGERTRNNSLRSNAFIHTISGVEADYDGGEISFEAAVERLEQAGVTALVYTTPSYTEEKPRWRVIAPLSAPVSGTTEELQKARNEAVDSLNAILGGGLAPESWTLSQSFYFGNIVGKEPVRAHVVRGDYIDDAAVWLDRVGKPGSLPRERSTTPADATPISEEQLRKMAAAAAIGCKDLHYPNLIRAVMAIARQPIIGRDDADDSVQRECALIVWNANSTSQSLSDDKFESAFTSEPPASGATTPGTLHYFACQGGWEPPHTPGPVPTPEQLTKWSALQAQHGGPTEEPTPEGEEDIFGRKPNPRIKLLGITDLRKMKVPTDLVEGLLTDGENVAFVSEPKAGKTFLALEVALSLAAGIPVLGKYPVKQKGHVIYLSGEGHTGMWKRIRAWGELRGELSDEELDALPFHYNKGVPLASRGIAEAQEFIAAVKKQIEAERGEVVLVVIDTMARSLGAMNENEAPSANQYLDLTEALRDGLNCTTLTLAHASNKDWAKKTGRVDFRGSSGFSAGFDSTWALEKNDETQTVTLRGLWFKEYDEDDRPPIYFQLQKSHRGAVLRLVDPPRKLDKQYANAAEQDTASTVKFTLYENKCMGRFAAGWSHQMLAEDLAGRRPPSSEEEACREWQTHVNEWRDKLRFAVNSKKVWALALGSREASHEGAKNEWRWWLREQDAKAIAKGDERR